MMKCKPAFLAFCLASAFTLNGCSLFPDRIKEFDDLFSSNEPEEQSPDALAQDTVRVSESTQSSSESDSTTDSDYIPDSRDQELEAMEQELRRYQRGPTVQHHFSPEVTHKQLYDYASQLAMELIDNTSRLNSRSRVGVASFVRLNRSLQEPTVMGNQLSEFLMGELQTFGLNVVDFKLTQVMTVTPFGDLAMSRDARELASETGMDHILTGTMVEDPRGVRVNARIVSVDSQQMVASASIYIPAFIVQSLYSHTLP